MSSGPTFTGSSASATQPCGQRIAQRVTMPSAKMSHHTRLVLTMVMSSAKAKPHMRGGAQTSSVPIVTSA